jgi:hypothetical protein
MATLLNFTSNFAVDTGEFAPGAKVSFFLSGTTTAVTVYQDEALTTPHPTPVEANASGRFPDIWSDGLSVLKAVVTDSDGATIDTFDPVTINGTKAISSQISDEIGVTVQAYDAGLTSIAGLTTSADQMVYTTASDTYATTSLTSFARTLLDDADASTARATLGVELAGRLLNVQVISASGTYTPTAGATRALAKGVGGGGGGGSADGDSQNTEIGVGGGGGSGAYFEVYFSIDASTYTATIGTGGAGSNSQNADGSTGVATSLVSDGDAGAGLTITANGGVGGASRADLNSSRAIGGAAGTATATGTSVIYSSLLGAVPGHYGFAIIEGDLTGAGLGASGFGGGNPLAGNTQEVSSDTTNESIAGNDATGPGAGGSGAIALGATTFQEGGDGADGIIIVFEYA